VLGLGHHDGDSGALMDASLDSGTRLVDNHDDESDGTVAASTLYPFWLQTNYLLNPYLLIDLQDNRHWWSGDADDRERGWGLGFPG
jgi:hypothetical protein